ncbi:MAG: tetraacyldisaccharide 4'-kinase [Desulfocapsaceae bacterium]|nr:tetraacyldisaccharide 4'-kinase [Desulfocapsaceae bacterium]
MLNLISTLYTLGRPLSPLYGLIMQARFFLYRSGIWQREKMDVPVISVGNLTMGGTGKTPVVRYLARFLLRNGYKPAIISRGYGGKAREKVNMVSDGKTILLDALQAGDEPRFLAESTPGVPVITGTLRTHPCHFAIKELSCDILILDDGFQHLAVSRDLDLVLFNALTLAGNNRVFPGGPLREPFSALSRADAFFLTGSQEITSSKVRQFIEFLLRRAPDRPVFLSTYSPTGCRKMGSADPVSLQDIPSRLFGFCGIAEPERFRKSLEDCGFILTGFLALRDHQDYSPDHINALFQTAEETGAEALITTEKDMVKLHKLHGLTPAPPLFSLDMDVGMDPAFDEYLLARLAAWQKRP